MKKLEELGIRPAPWSAKNRLGHRVFDRSGFEICDSDSAYSDVDSRLIAAAPELYECLREAVIEACVNMPCCSGAFDYKCSQKLAGKCFVTKWRKALAKAAGESEVK